MRCPDCSKFVSMENQDPEFNSTEAMLSHGDVHVEVSVRAVRCCADCGTELKSLDLDMEDDVAISSFDGWAELSDEDKEALLLQAEMESDSVSVEADENGGSMDESGGGRYKKNLITTRAEVNLTIEWERGPDDVVTLKKNHELTSENAASEFEECC